MIVRHDDNAMFMPICNMISQVDSQCAHASNLYTQTEREGEREKERESQVNRWMDGLMGWSIDRDRQTGGQTDARTCILIQGGKPINKPSPNSL